MNSRPWSAIALLAALAGCGGRVDNDPRSADAARDLTRTRRGWTLLAPVGADVRNGDYLTALGACQECHTLRGSDGEHLDMAQLFGGGIPFAGPWGVVASANASAVVRDLPPDTLENAIRGRLAYKFQMPTDLYAQMADDDMRDVVAYLQTLRPVERINDANTYDPTWRPPAPLPAVPHPAKPPQGVTVERGSYLATIAICRDCHSPRSAISPTGYDEEHKLSGGGLLFRTVDGKVIMPPNLTPDPETGLGSWTDDEVVRAIRTGVANDGHRLNPGMPYEVGLQRLTDDDVHALVLYLRSLPPIRRNVPANPIWTPGDAPASCCYPGPVGGFEGEPARFQ